MAPRLRNVRRLAETGYSISRAPFPLRRTAPSAADACKVAHSIGSLCTDCKAEATMSQHRVRHAAAEWDAMLLKGTAVLHPAACAKGSAGCDANRAANTNDHGSHELASPPRRGDPDRARDADVCLESPDQSGGFSGVGVRSGGSIPTSSAAAGYLAGYIRSAIVSRWNAECARMSAQPPGVAAESAAAAARSLPKSFHEL